MIIHAAALQFGVLVGQLQHFHWQRWSKSALENMREGVRFDAQTEQLMQGLQEQVDWKLQVVFSFEQAMINCMIFNSLSSTLHKTLHFNFVPDLYRHFFFICSSLRMKSPAI